MLEPNIIFLGRLFSLILLKSHLLIFPHIKNTKMILRKAVYTLNSTLKLPLKKKNVLRKVIASLDLLFHNTLSLSSKRKHCLTLIVFKL